MEYQLVVFELLNEQYGVDIGTVEGIIKMQAITKMPQAPRFVEGVTNVRGAVLPVIDLRKRFDLLPKEIDKDSRIVIVYMEDKKIGIIVDSVSEVLRISDEIIEPPPPMVTTVNSAFIKGIAKLEERLVILLDLEEVLSSEEKTELQYLPEQT